MNIPGISNLTKHAGAPVAASAGAAAAATEAASTATSGNGNLSSGISTLGPDAFLKLLTTQLANQDPMSPMDSTQSVAQLAQFSQLQASQNLNSSFTSFDKNFGILQSSALIGKTVSMNNTKDGGVQSGMVSAISFDSGTPTFTLKSANGQTVGSNFSLSQILSIS